MVYRSCEQCFAFLPHHQTLHTANPVLEKEQTMKNGPFQFSAGFVLLAQIIAKEMRQTSQQTLSKAVPLIEIPEFPN